MREILFRAKDFRNKWRYGYYDGSADDPALIEENDDMGGFWIQGETLGQFTGLYAKGVRVFEGDIVRCTHSGVRCFNGAVVFEDGAFLVEREGDRFSLALFEFEKEVIGNIYDNPELLEENTDVSKKF